MIPYYLSKSQAKGVETVYYIVFYVPESHLEEVKEALFAKGAGQFNRYRRCSWQTSGVGQFEPMEGSSPMTGEQGKLEQVDEYRVEIMCKDDILRDVLDELVEVHPYDEVAYYTFKIEQ